jgi:N-acetylglutamate synthase-like GNAT family acetyltransferase
MATTPPDGTAGPVGLRRATADDLPTIRAVIDAAYARYLTRMDKPPAPMLRDYGPSVEAGTTWVTGSPITAVLTLCPRDDHLYVENIAVDPSAQGRGIGVPSWNSPSWKLPAAGSAGWPWSPMRR